MLVRAAAGLPYVTICAVSDPSEEAAKRAEQLGVRVYSDYVNMLGKERLDGVIVATPEPMHVDPVIHCADADCHIFLEKPIARAMNEADQIITACERRRRKLMIGYILRFEPAYCAIKRAVAEGDIGPLKTAYARRNAPIGEARRLKGRTNVINYIGVHDIDQILWYADGAEVKSVLAKAVNGRVYEEFATWDFVWILIEFVNGSIGVVETGWGLQENSWADMKMNVIGGRGQCSLDLLPMNVMQVDPMGWKFPVTRLWCEVAGNLVGAVQTEIAHFIECIRMDREPCVSGIDGRRSLEVAIAAEMSIQKGKSITLPL